MKTRGLLLAGAALAGAAFLLAGCCTFSAPRYEGEPTEHFDGRQFVNRDPIEEKRFGDFLRWVSNRRPGLWTNLPYGDVYGAPPPERVSDGQLRVTFINHATTLVQVDGVNILTDPVWSERVGPRPWLGVKRRRPPGLRFEDLPPIDAVVISHNHYDHFDIPTLKRLAREHRPTFYVGLGSAALLERHGIETGVDLGWWESQDLANGLRVHAVPAQHFSNRGLCDRNANQGGGLRARVPPWSHLLC